MVLARRSDKNPAIIEFYGNRIEEQQKDLAYFEKVEKFALLPQEFTDGGNLMRL